SGEADPPRDRPGRMVGRREALVARPDLAGVWDAADALFPVRVTRSWWDRTDPSDPDDPLALQVLPDPSELVEAEGDLDDPVGELARSPVPWVVRKHADRVLLLVTKRCHLYCRYCFRRTHAPGDALDPSPEAWDAALAHAAASGATEAILSGGDPLAVRDEVLWDAIARLRAGTIRWVRVHTRAPITAPDRVTAAFARGLAERGPAWVVVHVNHARELAPDVDAALDRLRAAGLPVLAQTVLLRGVNDDADTLAALFEALVLRGIKPYYLHHPDAVTGNARFRVGPTEGLGLWEAVRTRVSGIALPRYVVDPPDGTGKVDVASWLARPGA
ncbi:MAG: KamA family radical SAM protein, partial [Myxococcales bacterium]|nr:KamA family radical SAM protein [Myxococcales bacterium]